MSPFAPAPAGDRRPALHPARRLHPLFHAGRSLLEDLLSTLVFVTIYAVTHDAVVATLIGVALGAGHILALILLRRSVDVMHWLSLGLVIVFGGATLLTHDPHFMMIKPSLIYAALGTAMLKRGWMLRYMPEVVAAHGRDLVIMFGFVWATMMFATAAANLLAVVTLDVRSWSLFIGVFPIASKVALVGVQYVVTRGVMRRRLKRGFTHG